MNKIINTYIPIIILLITVFSVRNWLNSIIGSFTTYTIVDFTLIYFIFKIILDRRYERNLFLDKTSNNIILIYLLWFIINIIRGGFVAENYWEWKQLLAGSLSLCLPLFIYIFSIPILLRQTLNMWLKYGVIIFLIILPSISTGQYHLYLGPIFVVGCFIPLVPKKWKIIFSILLVTMLFINLGARSQVIKSAAVLLVAVGIYFKRIIPYMLLKVIHWACYIGPIILLTLGITGTFNIFEDLSSNKGKYVEKKVVNGQIVEDDLSADTRTFIYVEVIESALRHNYVIWGRTPARGNDSMSFGAYNAENLKTGKYERHGNEICHTNVFTWLGLIGVILYSLIYLRSSYLAVYKSNNSYIKFMGCFIAFRWAYGWIEDAINFNIMNISLWMMITMGLSVQLRTMNNMQFKMWLTRIFKFN